MTFEVLSKRLFRLCFKVKIILFVVNCPIGIGGLINIINNNSNHIISAIARYSSIQSMCALSYLNNTGPK